MRRLILACTIALAAAAAIAGCAGSIAPSPVMLNRVPAPTNGTLDRLGRRRHRAGARFYLRIPRRPKHHRRDDPRFVSAFTESVGIVVTPASASPLPAVTPNVGPTAPGCQSAGSSILCTIDAVVVRGTTNTIAVSAYEGPHASGNLLSTATVATPIPASGPVSPLAMTLAGVVQSVGLSLVNPWVPIGSTGTLTVQAKDAAGETIVGPYNDAVPVSSSNAQVVLTTADGKQSGTSVSLTNSNQSPLTVSYTGGPTYETYPTSDVTLTASGASVALHPTSNAVAVAVPTSVPNPSAGSPEAQLVPQLVGGLLYFMVGAYTYTSNVAIGSFDPSSGSITLGSPLSLGSQFVNSRNGMAVDAGGNVWLDTGSDLYCLPSVTAPLPAPTPVSGSTVIAADNAGNVWYATSAFISSFTYLNSVYHFPAGCANVSSASSVPFTGGNLITGIAAAPSGASVYLQDQSATGNNVYSVSESISSQPTPAPTPDPVSASFSATSMAVDGSSNQWFGWESCLYSSCTGGLTEVTSAGSAGTNIPTNYAVGQLATQGSSLAASAAFNTPGFPLSPLNGTLNGMLLLIPDTAAPYAFLSPASAIANASPSGNVDCFGVFFDAKGGPWAACTQATSPSAPTAALNFVHVILTGDGFNIFYDPTQFAPNQSSVLVAVGGAAAGHTYDIACTGAITTCPASESFPPPSVAGSFSVATGSAGVGTLTVTDATTGQTEKANITVAPTPMPPEIRRHAAPPR